MGLTEVGIFLSGSLNSHYVRTWRELGVWWVGGGGGELGSAAMRLFARDDEDLGTKVSDVPPRACEWEGRARTTVRMKPHWGSFLNSL